MKKRLAKNKFTLPIYTKYVQALMMLAQACAATRRLVAMHSILFFSWYYLGIFLPWHQLKWAKALIKSKRIVILAPRGHGKTEVVSKVVPLWMICRDRNIRILMVTKAKDLARKNAMLIRSELVKNARLVNDFGAFYHRSECAIWTQSAFQVVRDKSMKDPTFEAVGIFGSITGGRCDLLITDDVIDAQSSNTPPQIQKVKDEISGTYIPLLEPSGQMWAIGTRKNYNDIYGSFLKNQAWTKIVMQGIVQMPAAWHTEELKEPIIDDQGFERWYRVVIDGPDPGQVLWEEKWPIERLLELQVEMGSVLWQREIQNNVVDEATALFPWVYLNQCKDPELTWIDGHIPPSVRRRYVRIIAGCDPALVTTKADAERKDSDYMVLVAIGLTKTGERHLLALERERGLTPAQVEKRIINFYKRVRPYRMLIERNSFGILHIHNLIAGTDMNIIPHLTSQNKSDPYEGVGHLSPLFENMKFRVPYQTAQDKVKTDDYLEEFHAFGSDVHDDQVMATWIAGFGILRFLVGQARLRKMRKETSDQTAEPVEG